MEDGSLLALRADDNTLRADDRARFSLSLACPSCRTQITNISVLVWRGARRVRRRLGALSLLSLIDGRAALFPLPALRARRGRQASALETRVPTARRHYARPFPSPDILGPRAGSGIASSRLILAVAASRLEQDSLSLTAT